MSFSLYEAVVPSYIQVLRSVKGLLDKAEAFCAAGNLAPEELIQARLAPDMLPFAFQVISAATHSHGAIEAVHKGSFSPDRSAPPGDFAALHARIDAALASLEKMNAADVDGLLGRDMRFTIGDRTMQFTAENFLTSFSQPNFYFHASTAYDILRWKGVQIGKRDFLGRPRTKT